MQKLKIRRKKNPNKSVRASVFFNLYPIDQIKIKIKSPKVDILVSSFKIFFDDKKKFRTMTKKSMLLSPSIDCFSLQKIFEFFFIDLAKKIKLKSSYFNKIKIIIIIICIKIIQLFKITIKKIMEKKFYIGNEKFLL